MAIEIVVPRLGWSMDEGIFGEWLKQDGEIVRAGDMLFVLEGEKASQEIESFDEGILKIPSDAPKPGDTVAVGQLLGYLVAEGEALPDHPRGEASAPAAGSAASGPAGGLGGSGASGRMTDNDVRSAAATEDGDDRASTRRASSPRARRVAQQLGVELQGVRGTGRNGRIRERDVRAAAHRPSEERETMRGSLEAAGQTIQISHVRRAIAERMLAGAHQAAPVTLTRKTDASHLVDLRGQFQAAATSPDDLVPSYTDVIVKLVAIALQQHPRLMAQWRDDGIFVPQDVHVAIAVDTEAGLFAPVIRDVITKSLRQIALESLALIEQARGSRLTVEQMRGATFTVTNLGAHGVDTFTPIINLPQSSILGLGAIRREPVVEGNEIVPRDMMSLSLTFDHRTVDGAPAAKFLNTLSRCIEQPSPWLIE